MKQSHCFFIAAVVLLSLSPLTPSLAQSTTKHSQTIPRHVTVVAQTYYVCNSCQMYFSAATAKKDHYKDSMGHKLVKVTTLPAGYMDGAKMGM